MIESIIVTGEGVTDLGVAANGHGVAENGDILVGPMLKIIYRLVYEFAPDWFREQCDWDSPNPIHTYLVSRSERARVSKTLKPNLFETHIHGKGGIEHSKGAWALATIGAERGATLAVYFHDTDGTLSVLRRTPDLQEIIENAAKRGFTVAARVPGVAMVPKPTSEAWMICHAKEDAYGSCELLETRLAGNQDSKARSPKVILEELRGDTHREALNEIVDEMDLNRLDMPSFNSFKESLRVAVEQLLGPRQ